MKLYADTPVRRSFQILRDLLFVCWVVCWIWVGGVVHDGTLALAAPGRQVEESATSLAEGLRDAGSFLDDLPLVGSGASVPLDKASAASEALADSGRAEVAAVEDLAFWLGLSIALIPILVVGAFYVPVRVRFAREATAGRRFIDAAADLDLFALRALTRQPMHVLARVSDDPAGAWRAREPDVIAALADLELRAHGLRPPRPLSAGAGPG
jgi:hypothetical protein